ncbi:hypothetical protein pb186bvf_017080 [Paramecium bursaria]
METMMFFINAYNNEIILYLYNYYNEVPCIEIQIIEYKTSTIMIQIISQNYIQFSTISVCRNNFIKQQKFNNNLQLLIIIEQCQKQEWNIHICQKFQDKNLIEIEFQCGNKSDYEFLIQTFILILL